MYVHKADIYHYNYKATKLGISFLLQVDFLDTNIIITEPYFNFTSIQESMNEILFEEYQFQAVLRVNGELKFLIEIELCEYE